MIKDLNWPLLQQRRQNMKLIMMYRIVYNLIAIPSQVYLTPVITTTTRGHSMRFIVPQSRIKTHQYSFFPSAIRLWNTLPDTLVVLSTLKGIQSNTVFNPVLTCKKNSFKCTVLRRCAHVQSSTILGQPREEEEIE